MSNPLFKELEIISLTNDIKDRENIINRYQAIGQIDRNDAITKIKKLCNKDVDVYIATPPLGISPSVIPFEQCTNEQLIHELEKQVLILSKKLNDKIQGDQDNANT